MIVRVARARGDCDKQIQSGIRAIVRHRANIGSTGAGRSGAGVSEQFSGCIGRVDQDLATKLRSQFKGTPRAEKGTPAEGNVGRRSGGVLADGVIDSALNLQHSCPSGQITA